MKALVSLACIAAFSHVAATQDGDHEHFQSIEVLPSPLINSTGPHSEAYRKAQDFLEKLTLEEKAGLVTGATGPCGGNIAAIPRLGFRGICFQDSPLGVRETDYTTVFPAGLSAAATFDRDMIAKRADLMGSEFRGKGIQAAMGPVAGGMGRHALGGRNWEGFGIDPYLAGVAMEVSVAGLQKNGVQSVGKHYIGNEQEMQRFPSGGRGDGPVIEALSSNIDDRTMHELYLWPFANGVKAGISWMMCGYQRLNQTYTCENSKALNGLLKEELGFQGAIISDWGATKSGLPSIEAGLDVTMPGGARSPFGVNIINLVNNGSLAEDRLDDMVLRVLTPFFHFGNDQEGDQGYPALDPSTNEVKANPTPQDELEGYLISGEKSRDVRGDHGDFVRLMGAASAVLVKNEGSLPLKKPKNIAVFGNDAADLSRGQFEATFLEDSVGPDFGTMAQGGGSGSARFTYFVSPLEAIKARGHADGAIVQYILDNKQAAESIHTIYPIPDVCLVFLKTYAAEGFDRVSLDVDWNGTAVVNTVAKRCPNTVVITHSAGINLMPWADNPNVTAIIAAHLPGQEAGNSIVDVLYGDYNPTGKLPYTVAFEESDYNAPLVNLTGEITDPNAWQADFTEGLLVDYRHFDAANITPRYEFGHGLSYTTFKLTDASIANRTKGLSPLPNPEEHGISPGGNSELYDTILTIQATVSNTGDIVGATIPQLYVSFPDSAPENTPVQVLRGFERTSNLEPGADEVVEFALQRRDLSFWDVDAQDWRIPGGQFTFRLGFSSRDVRQEIKAKVICIDRRV